MGPPMGHPMGHMMGPPPMGMPMGQQPMEGQILYGMIIRYDPSKGFGFIGCDALQDDIFFLRSEMPAELKDEPKDKVLNQQVEFELGRRDDGKWRARKLMLVQQRKQIREDEVYQGVILRFEDKKGYGFLKPDEIEEDVFFLRSELPAELRDFQNKSEIIQRQVEFNVETRPDGKLRALHLQLIGDGLPRENPSRGSREPKDEHPRELDEATIVQMTDFLTQNGGSFDYGRFASKFARVKKKQLEGHFNIVAVERGIQHIQLKEFEGNPAAAEGQMEDVEPGGQTDDAAVEPSIPLGSKGCQPHGVIDRYDPIKGVGAIRVVGFAEEISFGRPALPPNFQVRSQKFMPNLNGVQVIFQLNNKNGDKGPKADSLTLLLKHEPEEGCWLLKRESDSVME